MKDNSKSFGIKEIETTTDTFDENTTESIAKEIVTEVSKALATIYIPSSSTPASTTLDPSKKVIEDSTAVVKDNNSLIYKLNEGIVKEEKKEAQKSTKPPVMVEKILEALHEFPMQIQINAASEAEKGNIHKSSGHQ